MGRGGGIKGGKNGGENTDGRDREGKNGKDRAKKGVKKPPGSMVSPTGRNGRGKV